MSQTTFFKRKVLLVEDQTDLLELLRLQFREEGFATATATNGVDAIRKARSLVPDLILLDIMLPELDGLAVCEILRKDEATATVPILMITGLTGQLTRCAGMESGATEFVTKPFTVAQVVSKAKQMLANRPVPASAPANPLPITN